MSAGAFLSSFRRGIVASVRPQLRGDAAECLHHEIFLTTELLLALVALLAFPPYLGLWGKPDAAAAAIFALSVCPALCALYVSRTGRIETGRILSAISLAALGCVLCGVSGGLSSPFLALFAVLPGQVVLARGRAAAVGATVPFLGLGVVAALAAAGVVATGPAPALAVVATAGAAGLALLLAWSGRRFLHAYVDSAEARSGADSDLIDSAPDLVARLRRNGNVMSANAAAQRIVGTSAEELSGEGLVRRVHVQDRLLYLQALDAAWLDGSAVASIRLRGASGGYEEVELRARRIGEKRKDAEIVGVFRSVQARVETEAALRTALDAAERASIGKGRLLANMSHELRTPLNAILGFSEILADELFGKLEQERHREYAQLIHDSGSHLLDVVNAILDMSKLETGRFQVFPEPFALDETINSCCQLMRPQAQHAEVSLEIDGLGTNDELTADPRAVKQILLNLISNAVKFSPPGGKVMVGAYRDEAGAVAVYVADEGSGIAAEDIERLGEPFVQLKTGYAQGGGTGLGLSVVRGLAQLHDGSMRIESELGRGTRVTVVLPQEDGRPERKIIPVSAAPAAPTVAPAPARERLTA